MAIGKQHYSHDPPGSFWETKVLGLGSIIPKLKRKELTEGDNQKWSLHLNLTQHRKLHLCINRLNEKTTTATSDQVITCQNALEHWIMLKIFNKQNKIHALWLRKGTEKQTKNRNCLIRKIKNRNTDLPRVGTT